MTSWDRPSSQSTPQDTNSPPEDAVASHATNLISGANDLAETFVVADGRLEEASKVPVGSTPQDKVVLILCGLIASGKSTFAEQLQAHFPEFKRCNQDDLGDRRRVEQLARDSLASGHSVCIDRTNFNASQRFHWIKIAREFPGTQIWVIVFDTPYEVCAARLKERTGHPTITNPEQGLSVLSRFASDFQYPQDYEGFHRILYLKPSDHTTPEYGRTDIAAILQRVRDSEPPSGRQGELGLPSAIGGSPGFQPGRGRGRGRGNGYTQQRGWGWRGGRPTYGHQTQTPTTGAGAGQLHQGPWQGGRGRSPGGWRDEPNSGNRPNL